jgi:hypothetical protein|tara:strand:- start:3030 stop:3722 length:693 start_codon:yes stop_codon:yes gene_type:complete
MTNDFKVIRGGKTGTGLLIEGDAGFIEPRDLRNKPFITEANKIGTGPVMIEPLELFVVLQKYGIENRNGRIYPEDILKREARKYQELIDMRLAIGESDHPESSVISNSRVSHEIKKIWWEGQTLVGTIEIIMSPGFVNQGIISCEGDQIANLLRKGIRVGVSSRGVGSLNEIGGKLLVQDDFEIICWDIVTSPSTPGSYMFSNRSEAQPFMESVGKKDNLLIDKLNRFLL